MDFILKLAAVVATLGLCVSVTGMAFDLEKQDTSNSTREAHSTAAPVTPVIHDAVYIFVSFSMPKESLQQWAAQAQKIHAPLVIQGLVDHSFTQTQQAVKALSENNSGGVVLDPRLFHEYHITQAPTVVVRRIPLTPCPANQSCWQAYDAVSGDIGLEAALQLVADRGDVADVARSLLSPEVSS